MQLSRRKVITLASGVLLVAPSALAHAVLLEIEPSPKSTVAKGKVVIKLRYNARIDIERSRLFLVPPNRVAQAIPLSANAAPDTLQAEVTVSEPGEYGIRWQVLATDGHITRGETVFRVS
jgi:copper resistance protein C